MFRTFTPIGIIGRLSSEQVDVADGQFRLASTGQPIVLGASVNSSGPGLQAVEQERGHITAVLAVPGQAQA